MHIGLKAAQCVGDQAHPHPTEHHAYCIIMYSAGFTIIIVNDHNNSFAICISFLDVTACLITIPGAQASDGNLVLYAEDGTAVWSSETVRDAAEGPFKLTLQDDGNAVVYAQQNAVWGTGAQA